MMRDMKLAAFSRAAGIPWKTSVDQMTVGEYTAMAQWLVSAGSLPSEMALFGDR